MGCSPLILYAVFEEVYYLLISSLYERFYVPLGPGVGDTPYNGLYEEAPPERGAFFRLQVYKRVGISQV